MSETNRQTDRQTDGRTDGRLKHAENLEITPEIFEKLRGRDDIMCIFNDLDLADDDQFNLFETLDADGGGTIDMDELFAADGRTRPRTLIRTRIHAHVHTHMHKRTRISTHA